MESFNLDLTLKASDFEILQEAYHIPIEFDLTIE